MSAARTVNVAMPVLLPAWIVYLQALAVPAVALLAALIAYRQWRTAHAKILLDLFDRRYDIYTQLNRAIDDIFDEVPIDKDQLKAIERASEKMRFLFGPEVAVYMRDLSSSADQIFSLRADPRSYNQADYKEDRRAAMRRFRELYDKRFDVFGPYLGMNYKGGEMK